MHPDPDAHPLARLLGLSVAGGGTAGLVHGLTGSVFLALLGATLSLLGAAVLEYLRPSIRRRGELRAERLYGPAPSRPPAPPAP